MRRFLCWGIAFSWFASPLAAVAFGQTGTEELPNVSVQVLNERASLLLGYNFFREFRDNQIDLDVEKVIEGIRLAAAGEPTGMSDEEMQLVLAAFERQLMSRQEKVFHQQAAKNLQDGIAFREKNQANAGVQTTESGLQYAVLATGSGDTPQASDRVKIHYHGTFIDGKVFDSSRDGEPVVLPVSGAIRGMTEALQKMRVGDKWQVVVPPELAYGLQGRPPVVGPNQTLIFELELVEIVR